MRLSQDMCSYIKRQAKKVVAADASVLVFGSRVDDSAKGGDLDIIVESNIPILEPALASSRLAAQISRRMLGRKVDVLLTAPNIAKLPIHEIAKNSGVKLWCHLIWLFV